MNFGWFFEMPGLFITGGVVLIIIALVVFLIGSKKGENVKVEENTNVESVPEVGKEETVAPAPESPVDSVTIAPVETITPVAPVEPVAVEPIAPVAPVEPVAVEPVAPVATPEPVTIEPVAPAEPAATEEVKPAGVEEI